MIRNLIFLVILLLLGGCQYESERNKEIELFFKKHTAISYTNDGCDGFYEGPETKFGTDIAHQFSNLMADYVGRQLKELYIQGKYSRVDFSKIEMTTKGMNTGNVQFELRFPFEKVNDRCNASTSFDHVGGWGHRPELNKRIKELKNELLPNDELHISSLKQTPEGLKEYWIQWRNKEIQADCN